MEAVEEIPMEHGPMQTNSATKKHPQGHDGRKGKALEDAEIPKDDDDASHCRGRRKNCTKEQQTRKQRRYSSDGDSFSKSGRSSHGQCD
ncbi:hypothetical protein GOP47_0030234 [Adiantum capillus-veneris]|nr:hypothetical protein GOP47_0030234 [Adiantum capillus-veneris]